MFLQTYLNKVLDEKTLSSAEAELDVIEGKCYDGVVDTKSFIYNGDTLSIGGVCEQAGFTPTGLDQFGRFLGVKAYFFNRLRSVTRYNVFTDVIEDAHSIQSSAKVRFYDGNVRAVLGAEYTPISPKMLIHALRGAGFDETSLALRLFADYEATDLMLFSKEPLAGDNNGVMHSGLIMRDDSIGRESASIKCFLYNSELNSGIIYNVQGLQKFRFNHTKNVESKMAEAIKYCVAKFVSWFENAGEAMRKLQETTALEHERLVPMLKSIAVRVREIEALLQMEKLVDGRAYSVWDLISTISRYSASIEDRNRTFELMEIAGAIMSCPKPFSINWID